MGRVPAARVVAAGAGRAAPIVGRVGQLAFQALELLAEGGLDDVLALGCPPEVQLLGQRHEEAQLTKLDVAPARRVARPEAHELSSGQPIQADGSPRRRERWSAGSTSQARSNTGLSAKYTSRYRR
jgi:hypothetical protein